MFLPTRSPPAASPILDSCAVAGTQELAGPACGSVGDRREGTVRGYRKARHVRAHVGFQVLDIAADAQLDRRSVAEHQMADFAGRIAASVASLEQGLFVSAALGPAHLHPAFAGDPQRQTRWGRAGPRPP